MICKYVMIIIIIIIIIITNGLFIWLKHGNHKKHTKFIVLLLIFYMNVDHLIITLYRFFFLNLAVFNIFVSFLFIVSKGFELWQAAAWRKCTKEIIKYENDRTPAEGPTLTWSCSSVRLRPALRIQSVLQCLWIWLDKMKTTIQNFM